MISKSELNPNAVPLDAQQQRNLDRLYLVMNLVRAEYGMPMRITSGVRSVEDEKRIDPAHPHSQHLQAAACDIYDPDPDRRLWNWCIEHLDFITELGLFLESRVYSTNHVHFQIIPPHSGQRIFVP